MEEAKAQSAVDHPSHYGGADNPFEVIKVMEAWLTREQMIGALKFTIYCYLARSDFKNGSEDNAKAAWYVNFLKGYEERHPAPEKVDGALSRQLQKSMELNAKIKNELRKVQQGWDNGLDGGEHSWLTARIDEILRLG